LASSTPASCNSARPLKISLISFVVLIFGLSSGLSVYTFCETLWKVYWLFWLVSEGDLNRTVVGRTESTDQWHSLLDLTCSGGKAMYRSDSLCKGQAMGGEGKGEKM
jgi:hypothetical protein